MTPSTPLELGHAPPQRAGRPAWNADYLDSGRQLLQIHTSVLFRCYKLFKTSSALGIAFLGTGGASRQCSISQNIRCLASRQFEAALWQRRCAVAAAVKTSTDVVAGPLFGCVCFCAGLTGTAAECAHQWVLERVVQPPLGRQSLGMCCRAGQKREGNCAMESWHTCGGGSCDSKAQVGGRQ